MLKKSFSIICLLTPCLMAHSQITKTNIVEHFTNSNCSICASQNPGIYSTLSNHPNVLHITFHPSAPYASCVFSMENPLENDARTNFYGIYGGTPKLMVNGSLTTTANLNSSLMGLNGGTTNFSVQTTQQFITADSVDVKVIVKRIATDSNLTQALLFVGAKQDTINQTTGNGESIHQDVFRKGLTAMTGSLIALPVNVNDSNIYTYGYKVLPGWIASDMQTIAILQNAVNKSVINASESVNVNSIPTNTTIFQNKNLTIFPNPVSSHINFIAEEEFANYEIVSSTGKVVNKGKLDSNRISVRNIANGVYLLTLIGSGKQSYTTFVIKH